jgi:predicted porin
MKIYPALAVAALSSIAGLAHAQSTLAIFGIADIGILSTSASGSGSVTSLNGDGNTSSRLGFRGTEDLGGGLKASFHLEGAVNFDSGAGGTTNLNNKDANVGSNGFTFGRRSTIGLSSSMGEIRLGRDYVPSFNNLTVSAHPFGTNGVGNAGQMYYQVNAGGTSVRTNVRASNSVGYFTPSGLGGFSGHVMYAMGEQASNTVVAGKDISKDGNHLGARIAYSSGPLYLSFASGKTNYATGDYTQTNFAANYQFGPAKLMYLWGENKVGVTKTTANMVGTRWTVGAGEVRFAYTELTADKVANDANQWAIGYVHNLSKRTALYTNYSEVKNKGTGKQFTVGGGNSVTEAGGSSTGAEFGVRHSF